MTVNLSYDFERLIRPNSVEVLKVNKKYGGLDKQVDQIYHNLDHNLFYFNV
jgi:hypothetical protein